MIVMAAAPGQVATGLGPGGTEDQEIANMTYKTQDLVGEYYQLSQRDKALLARGEAIADLFGTIGRAIARVVAKIYAPLKSWAIERATRDELLSLDDRTLADIGLTRGDIPQVASGLWVPENRLAQVRAAQPALASNVNSRPQIAA